MDSNVGDEMVNAFGEQALDVDDEEMFETLHEQHEEDIEE